LSYIDQELRDKIIETNTLVVRMDEEHKESKRIMNARFREAKLEFVEHKHDVTDKFDKHDKRINNNERFRTRVIAYAVAITGLGTTSAPHILDGLKKWFGG